MTFDDRGNLTPYRVIETNWVIVEQMFATEFPESYTRNGLLANFKVLCESIRQLLGRNFKVWVDGSFVMQKLNPNDIDIVFFIDSIDYSTHETTLRQLTNRDLCQKQGIDCYLVRVYPQDHPNYQADTEFDTKEWLSLFSRTRVHRNGKRYPKGIIQLLF